MFELQGWNGWKGQWETVTTIDDEMDARYAYAIYRHRRPTRLLKDGNPVLGDDSPYAFHN